MASTSVVFPWSTWAMIATFRRSLRTADWVTVLILVEKYRGKEPGEPSL